MNRHESPASEAEPTGGLQVARSWFFAKLLAVVGFFAGGCVALGIGFFASHPPPPPPGQGICGMGIIAGFIIMLLSPAAALLCSLVVAPVGAILDLVFPRVSPRVWHVGIALANGIFTVATVLFLLFFAYPFLLMIPLASASLLDAVTLTLLLALILVAVIGTGVTLLRWIRKA